MPLINRPSSLAKYKHILAISFGSVRRLRGTCAMKFFLFSGVSGTPVNISKSPVPERRGQTEFTRMLWGPYSAARPLVAYVINVSMVINNHKCLNNGSLVITYVGNSTLSGIVPDQTRSRTRSPCGRDVDYRATLTLFNKARNHGLYRVENALDIDLEDTFPFFLGHFQSGLWESSISWNIIWGRLRHASKSEKIKQSGSIYLGIY